MAFTVSYMREMYEKAYNEGIRACDMNDFATAKKKLSDAVIYLKRLSQMDEKNKDTHLKNAERIERIVRNMPDSPSVAQPVQPIYGTGRGAGADTGNPPSRGVGTMGTNVPEDMSSFYQFYEPGDLEIGFDDVIGLQEAKEAITEYAINPIKYPESYNYKFMSSQCILLEGDPGTGKTTFAMAVSKEINQPFALINVASLVSCYVGETGKLIDKVFSSLREYAEGNNCGLTIFFDEFDEIAKSRAGDDKASQSSVPALLRNLDGVKKNKNFLILANTNCKDSLDKGILSRFRRKICIPLPDEASRKIFFEKKLRDSHIEDEYLKQLDLDKLAKESEGKSGRDITYSCDEFLHYLGGVKQGLRACGDLTQAMIDIIKNKT